MLPFCRVKRQKAELYSDTLNPQKKENCTHPGSYGGLCMKCGQRVDDDSAIPLKYIDKVFWIHLSYIFASYT